MQCSKPKRKVLNFIAVTGFIFSFIAILLCPLCLPQVISLAVSIFGYEDAKKCDNRGKVFGLLGIIISIILMIIGPVMLYLMIKGILKFILVFDFTNATLFLEYLTTVLRFLMIIF